MMSLQLLSKKLRRAADVLDELLQEQGTPAKAAHIVASLGKRRYVKRVAGAKKGYKYNGKHWTQRPENAHKVRRAVKRMKRANRA